MDYMFGRLALGILKGFSWLALILGLFIAFGGVSGGLVMFARQDLGIGLPTAFFSILSGFMIALFAMIALAFLDHMSATIDTAIWAKKSFKISEQQLAVSKEVLRVGKLVQAVQAPEQLLSDGASNEGGIGRVRSLLGMLSRKAPAQPPNEGRQRQMPTLTGNATAVASVSAVQQADAAQIPNSDEIGKLPLQTQIAGVASDAQETGPYPSGALRAHPNGSK